MLGLLKKNNTNKGLFAVCADADGIALARVLPEAGAAPVLVACEYAAAGSDEDRARALHKLVRVHHLDRTPCTSVMAMNEYNLLLVEAPDVPPAELRAAIRWRIKDLIDFHVDDAVVDVFEVPTHKLTGRRSMMYAVVARAATVKARVDELLDAGVRLSVLDIPELALRNIAALLPEDVGGVALVYLGRDSGLITITRQGTLYLSRRIEGGVHDIGSGALSGEAVKWLDSVVIEVQRSLDYYESHFGQPPVSGLAVTPLGEGGAGVASYLAGQLDMPGRALDLNELIDVPERLPVDLQIRCLQAIGAALRMEGKAL